MRRALNPLSWLVGIALVVAVVIYVGPREIVILIGSVGPTRILAWVAVTVLARLILTETTLLPLRELGFQMRRSDAFWIGWLRTFANQIFPAAGVAAYVQTLRRKIDISWSELASLATPQFVLSAAALGLVGLVAVLSCIAEFDQPLLPLLLAYGVIFVSAVLVAQGAHGVLRFLPARLAERLAATSDALHRVGKRPKVLLLVIACHAGTILLRGGRLWLLLNAAGVTLDWNEVLLIVAVAESSMLIQLTPGGLGIREGAVLAGAALVGVPVEIAAGVAVIDRILIIAITALLTPPAILILRRELTRD